MDDEFGFYLIFLLLMTIIVVFVYSYIVRNRKNKTLLNTPVQGVGPGRFTFRMTILIVIGALAMGIAYIFNSIIIPLIFFVLADSIFLIYWTKTDRKKDIIKGGQ